MKQTLGHNKSHVVTSPIQIKNGNTVQEELTYTFHKEEYEGRSLLNIQGSTVFLKVA